MCWLAAWKLLTPSTNFWNLNCTSQKSAIIDYSRRQVRAMRTDALPSLVRNMLYAVTFAFLQTILSWFALLPVNPVGFTCQMSLNGNSFIHLLCSCLAVTEKDYLNKKLNLFCYNALFPTNLILRNSTVAWHNQPSRYRTNVSNQVAFFLNVNCRLETPSLRTLCHSKPQLN